MSAALSSKGFQKALAIACMRAIGQAPIAVHDCTDTLACAFGATTKAIAKQAKLSVPQTRRRLLGMIVSGKLLRFDREGGSTTWWPVGLAELHKPAIFVPATLVTSAVRLYHNECHSAAAAPARQAFTPPLPVGHQHWSEVLGVPRDCSTSEARAAFQTAIATLDQANPDYPNLSRRVRDAIDACCREHEIQIEE